MAKRDRLLLVGFPRTDAFRGPLPEGVRRVALEKALDAKVPLLVHARAYPDLVRYGITRPFPLIVVYRPQEVSGTSVVAPFILDDVSGDADFASFLNSLLTLLPAYEAAHNVPEAFFQRLQKSVRALQPADVPVPDDERRRLVGSARLLATFQRLLVRRRAQHALTVTPSARTLLGYLRGELDSDESARIEAYVEASPAAQAKLIALRQTMGLKDESTVLLGRGPDVSVEAGLSLSHPRSS